jgi:hypothetical protein
MRLDGARTSNTPTANVQVLLELDTPAIVTRASYSPPIRRRSSPFVMPVHPRPATVSTLWPFERRGKIYRELLVKKNAHQPAA